VIEKAQEGIMFGFGQVHWKK